MKKLTGWLPGWVVAFAMVGLVAGCGGNHQSIFRHQQLKAASSITTIDAKQRAIIAANRNSSTLKFCAEPSPDVFSVVAQAISAGGTFGQRADPRAIEAALSAAFSSSEQGSTIPRTQTINMLRELMYRTCERWLNNELSDAEMPIQAARDQRLMVSILAIEQLTGAVTAKPVVIGSSSDASAGASGADAAIRIDDSFKSLSSKTAAQQARQKEFDALNTGENSCDALAKKVEAKTLEEEQKPANAKCDEARTTLSQAKLERASAAGHHQSLLDATRAGGIPASAQSSADSPSAAGGIDRAHTTDVREVAAIVQDIVRMNFEQDEFLLFCLKVLGNPANASNADKPPKTDAEVAAHSACVDHIQSSIELETARQQQTVAEIKAATGQMQKAVQGLFESFWVRIKNTDDQADAVKLKSILEQARVSSEGKVCLLANVAKASIKECFDGLGGGAQRELAGRGGG